MSKEATVRCTSCGREWFGVAAVDAMKAIGHCIRCRGAVDFPARAGVENEDDALAGIRPGMEPHQVLGPPRI